MSDYNYEILRATLSLFEKGAHWGSLHTLPEWPKKGRSKDGRVKKAASKHQTTGASQPDATVGRSRVPSRF